MRKAIFIFASLLLVAAVAIQVWPRASEPESPGFKLAELTSVADTLRAKPVPLGATEAMTATVAGQLRYDEVLCREFQTPRGAFLVYVAYWAPGKMPTQVVASHTPDRCWSEAGWLCTKQVRQSVLAAGQVSLKPGEGRIFESPQKQVQHVIFWHLIGPELYDYGERFNRVPSVWRWCRDAARQVLFSPQRQYFIRISSERSFDELKNEPAFEKTLAAIARLGIAATP